MNWFIIVSIIWVGCFLVVSIDSAYCRISPVFWRLASLFGGPFALLSYSLIREQAGNEQGK